MDTGDRASGEELFEVLDLARQALTAAYQLAPDSGYRAGSWQMHALHRVERAYQQAQVGWASRQAEQSLADPGRQQPGTVIDVRDQPARLSPPPDVPAAAAAAQPRSAGANRRRPVLTGLGGAGLAHLVSGEYTEHPTQPSEGPAMTSSGSDTGQVTGTADKDYNIIWFTEVCLSNVLRLQTYIADADRDGDSELADFFRKAQAESRKGAEQGKKLLKARLNA